MFIVLFCDEVKLAAETAMVSAPGAVILQSTSASSHQNLIRPATLDSLPVASVLPGTLVCWPHRLGLVVSLTTLDPVVVSVTVCIAAGVTLALHHGAGHVLPTVYRHPEVGGEGVAVAVAVLWHHAALEVVNSVSWTVSVESAGA